MAAENGVLENLNRYQVVHGYNGGIVVRQDYGTTGFLAYMATSTSGSIRTMSRLCSWFSFALCVRELLFLHPMLGENCCPGLFWPLTDSYSEKVKGRHLLVELANNQPSSSPFGRPRMLTLDAVRQKIAKLRTDNAITRRLREMMEDAADHLEMAVDSLEDQRATACAIITEEPDFQCPKTGMEGHSPFFALSTIRAFRRYAEVPIPVKLNGKYFSRVTYACDFLTQQMNRVCRSMLHSESLLEVEGIRPGTHLFSGFFRRTMRSIHLRSPFKHINNGYLVRDTSILPQIQLDYKIDKLVYDKLELERRSKLHFNDEYETTDVKEFPDLDLRGLFNLVRFGYEINPKKIR